MVFSAFAETRSLTERPSASDMTVTWRRLGRNRRLVLRLEWLTLCPTCAVLPVSSHRRDMAESSSFRSRPVILQYGIVRYGRAAKRLGLVGDRGRIVAGGRSVKQGLPSPNRARFGLVLAREC